MQCEHCQRDCMYQSSKNLCHLSEMDEYMKTFSEQIQQKGYLSFRYIKVQDYEQFFTKTVNDKTWCDDYVHYPVEDAPINDVSFLVSKL